MKTEPLKLQNLDEAGNRESRETRDELFASPGDFKGTKLYPRSLEVTVFQSLGSGHMVTISQKVMLRIVMSLVIFDLVQQ